MKPLLEMAGVTAGYNGVPAIDRVSLQVGAGEVVVLLGSNGAGKTTTLRAVVGRLPCLSGTVEWRGKEIKSPMYARVAAGIGYVPEGRSAFMELTVQENLRVGSGSVEQALNLFPELRDHLKRRAGDLSGGQQQMLSVARVLAAKPSLLLADELSLGLAPVLVQRLAEALMAAARDGIGVLMVEQHAKLALDIADRAYILRRGEIVADGPAKRFRDQFDELQELYMGQRDSASVK